MAIDSRLSVDAPDALDVSDVEGIDSNESPGEGRFDVALAELRLEAFEESDLLI